MIGIRISPMLMYPGLIQSSSSNTDVVSLDGFTRSVHGKYYCINATFEKIYIVFI